MYGTKRTKRVTDPLDDKVKARITGRDRFDPDYVSSGSEHSAHADDGVTSPSFSDLFFGFSVDDAGGESPSSPERNDSCSERDSSVTNVDRNEAVAVAVGVDRTDEFRNALEDRVLKAAEVFGSGRAGPGDKQTARRSVMAFLRNCGYEAAVCKTRWGSGGGITAGSHEFVDVIADGGRYFVDLDFAAEFEIARPTSSYERLLRRLPVVFVGGGEDLKRILRAASDAAKRSLRSGGLHLPPWRKHRFMQNKWLGAYRRTTNVFPASFSSASKGYGAVECRAVGFADGRLLLPATARTR